jgi:hypothetical protein
LKTRGPRAIVQQDRRLLSESTTESIATVAEKSGQAPERWWNLGAVVAPTKRKRSRGSWGCVLSGGKCTQG